MDDDELPFEPRIGRAQGRGSGRKYLHKALAAANLAKGGSLRHGSRGSFSGSRIGRGSGVGRVLGGRAFHSALRKRRVIIKSRLVRLAGKGLAGAQAHLRYIERDGTTREGERGDLYDALDDQVDRNAFLEVSRADRHQFRFIVSAEDGADYDDLKPLVRRLMARMEEDLGTRLEWVAVDHHNTGHPHTHIILRGKDDQGCDLVIARDYIKSGMRERAAEIVDLDLGPRSDRAIEERLRAEVEQERLTSIDRTLLRDTDDEGLVRGSARSAFDQAIRLGRLKKLERMGLAHRDGGKNWRLSKGLAQTLTRMSEKGDIIRTMQRALTEAGRSAAPADLAIYDGSGKDACSLVGRILERGLSNELDDRHYLILEDVGGRTSYVEIGKAVERDSFAQGSIVRIDPLQLKIREADRTIAEVAAANGGRYNPEAHLRYEDKATRVFAEAHVRRLEAIRRVTGAVERDGDGTWIIAPDHLDRALTYETIRAKDRPVSIELLSSEPLALLATADAATWLDKELVSDAPLPLRGQGFGREVELAKAQRQQWLVESGLAEEREGGIAYRPGLVGLLRRRDLLRAASRVSEELRIPFSESPPGSPVEGLLRRRIDLLSGRFALIERSRDFTLVPWRPVLEHQIGKRISGIMRTDGVSWTIGRVRSGPSIS
jgi:type IV secretory pathway VirD2 relaxase